MMTMTEGSNYPTVGDGQLCFWQVFELMQEFKDRPADASGDRVFSEHYSKPHVIEKKKSARAASNASG